MKKKENISTVFLIISVLLIIVMGVYIYMQKAKTDRQIAELTNNASVLEDTIDNLQGKINNVSNIEDNNTKKVEIPKANTNMTEKEEKAISDYFQGVWITSSDENLLVVDYGKRFCDINKSNNSKEYGTYTVKYENELTITLTYTSGKILELELVQGNSNYLMSADRKVKYGEYEGYYFGTGEGDEGIFDDDKSIPSANTSITENEKKVIEYFKGIWTTNNGENLIAIDNGKRFCDINKSNNSKEYGTYTVKDGAESTITLTYTSGKTLKLKLIQGASNYLMSTDEKVKYEQYNAYYFGDSEGDEGIFNN